MTRCVTPTLKKRFEQASETDLLLLKEKPVQND
jgi:hypothetical protein